MTKKNNTKWYEKKYMPSDFKYIREHGSTQISIGIVIAIFSIILNQNPFLFFGGVAWSLFGVFLVILDHKKNGESDIEDKQTDRSRQGHDLTNTDKEEIEDEDEYYDGL